MKSEHIEIAEQIARDASCAQGEFNQRVLSIIPYLADVCDRASLMGVHATREDVAEIERLITEGLGYVPPEQWLPESRAGRLTPLAKRLAALPHTGPPQEGRDQRQQVVVEWGTRCFGADHMADKIVRAARLFEEAAELVQAVGLSRDHALRAAFLRRRRRGPAGGLRRDCCREARGEAVNVATTYEAMRKGGAVRNAIFHAVDASRIRTTQEALCGAKPKTSWVYCATGEPENITCGRCAKLLALSSDHTTKQGD